MIIVLPQSSGKHLDLVLESQEALTVPVSATRIRAQNGLSASGTNKYTLTARISRTSPKARRRRLTK